MIEKITNMENWHALTPEEVKIIARKLNELVEAINTLESREYLRHRLPEFRKGK